MADTPIAPIENEAPPAVETTPAAVEAPQESSKIDSSSAIEKKFKSLVDQYEREDRPDARDEAALQIIEDISALTDVMSEEMQKKFIASPTMVIEVLNRIGLKEERAEILAPLGVEIGTLGNRLTAVRNRTKQKLKALRNTERETREREERKADYAERLGELNETAKKATAEAPKPAVVPEVVPPILKNPDMSSTETSGPLPEIPLVERTNTGFEDIKLAELKKIAANYDKILEKLEKERVKAYEDLAKIKATKPGYKDAFDKAENIYKRVLSYRKLKKIVVEVIGRKAGTETEEPVAVVVANVAETAEPIVAAGSDITPVSETKTEVAEKFTAETMLTFLKAFGLPKTEYIRKDKEESERLVAKNFNEYKNVFQYVIENWNRIEPGLRPPMLIVDGKGNEIKTFTKFVEAMTTATPKERAKIKNSYIEFVSVVGSSDGGAIGSLAGVELSGRGISSGVNVEGVFTNYKTVAKAGLTRRSSVVPGTTSAVRPVETVRVAPVAPVVEVVPPAPTREELVKPSVVTATVETTPPVPEKMIPGRWSGLLEKGGRRVENVSTAVEKALQELPALGRLEFGTQSDGNSLIVEKTADGKYKLTGIEGGKLVEKGKAEKLVFKPEPSGSFFGLTWAGGEYLNIREYRSLAAEVVKPVVAGAEASKPVGDISSSKGDGPEKVVGSPEAAGVESLLDLDLLKSIQKRCFAKHEGKYPNSLYGINFELNERETEEIAKLIKEGRAVFEKLTQSEPLWIKFKTALEERRGRVGPLAESSSIISDPEVHDVVRFRIKGDILALRVPPQIRDLYDFEDVIISIEGSLRDYKSGVAKARAASYLGKDLEALYLFIRDASSSVETPVTAPPIVETPAASSPPEKPADSTVPAEPAGLVETARDEKERMRDEYSKLSDLDLRKVDFDLVLDREKDEENPELKLRLAIIKAIKEEKIKASVEIFTEKHRGKLVSDLESRRDELGKRRLELKSALQNSRKTEPRIAARETEAQIMLDLSECGAEEQAIENLLNIPEAESPVGSSTEPASGSEAETGAAETATDEVAILAEYKKNSILSLQNISPILGASLEEHPDDAELILRKKVLDQVLKEKLEAVQKFLTEHKDDSLSDLKRRLEELTEAKGRVEQGLLKALAAGNEITAGIIKGLLAEHDVEITAIKTLLDQKRSAETAPAAPEVAIDEAAILAEYRKERGSTLQRLSFELDAALKGDLDNKELEKRRKVLDQVLEEKFNDLIESFMKDYEGEPVSSLENRAAALRKEFSRLKNELRLAREAGRPIGEIKLALTSCDGELGAVNILLAQQPVEAVPVASTTTEIPTEAQPDEAEKPPVVETPIDLNSSINELSSRLETLRAKEAEEPGMEPSEESASIQQELDRRYQDFVRTLTEKMKDFPSEKLEEKVARLSSEEERLVESNTNPQRLMKVRAEIQAAQDLLVLIEAEGATSSAAEVSDTPSSETAPVEAASPVEAPTETEAPPVNPAIVSPAGPARFDEITGEKRLEDMDADELRKKAISLESQKGRLTAKLLKTVKTNKKERLSEQIVELDQQLEQVNQRLASI
ncbi:MAG: hypothetical protein V1716_04135 [Candidatus Uhrbacteria bacterium]